MSDLQPLTMMCNHLYQAQRDYKSGFDPKGCNIRVCKVIRLDEFNKPMAIGACSLECLEYLEKLWSHRITTHKNNIFPVRSKL